MINQSCSLNTGSCVVSLFNPLWFHPGTIRLWFISCFHPRTIRFWFILYHLALISLRFLLLTQMEVNQRMSQDPVVGVHSRSLIRFSFFYRNRVVVSSPSPLRCLITVQTLSDGGCQPATEDDAPLAGRVIDFLKWICGARKGNVLPLRQEAVLIKH